VQGGSFAVYVEIARVRGFDAEHSAKVVLLAVVVEAQREFGVPAEADVHEPGFVDVDPQREVWERGPNPAASCTAPGSASWRLMPARARRCTPGSAAARSAIAASWVTGASAPDDSRAASASAKKTGCFPVLGCVVPAIVKACDSATVTTETRAPTVAGPATTISSSHRRTDPSPG
jgi:hypothetical protein